MKNSYFPPSFQTEQFHCIHCNVFAKQTWLEIYYGKPFISGVTPIKELKASTCSHCRKLTFWYEGKMVIPDMSPVESAHNDLPNECRDDYEEARSVFTKSPKAASALLRLCIQKLMPHLGESGKNINNDIKSLVEKGLPPLVQKALDFCRVVGNNAVHPGEITLNDTPEIAQSLFKMINFIVEDRIARPKEIENLYNQLPQASLDAIEARDK